MAHAKYNINKNIFVDLDLEITPELEEEGIANEFIAYLNKIRRKKGYKAEDKISAVRVNIEEEDYHSQKALLDYIARIKIRTNIEKFIWDSSITENEYIFDAVKYENPIYKAKRMENRVKSHKFYVKFDKQKVYNH